MLESFGDSMEAIMIAKRFEELFQEWNDLKGPRDGIHASTILQSFDGDNEFCYREQVLNWYYRPRYTRVPQNVLRYFLHGWILHEKWQRLFTQSGISVNVETTRVSDLWKVMHTPDAIIELNYKKYIGSKSFLSLHKCI